MSRHVASNGTTGKPAGVIEPHNLAAEEALLGAMLITAEAREIGLCEVSPDDFHKPAHGHIFDAIATLHGSGQAVDPTTLADQLARDGLLEAAGGAQYGVGLQANVPATSSARRYARIIVEHAALRRLARIGDDLAGAARGFEGEPAELIDRARAAIAAIDMPVERVPDDLYRLHEFMAAAPAEVPWLVEGLVRESWRVIVVGLEGSGKTVLLRQLAMCAAGGRHPFTYQPAVPVTTLLVDLENPADVIVDGARVVDAPLATARRAEGGCWLWHRPGGINLRSRQDRASFESVLANCQPRLVCLGPVYKCYTALAREPAELVAAEVQAVLDDLRTRYQFALVMEHHAPHGDRGAREMRPFGSSLWLRWPEFGIGLRRVEDPSSGKHTSLAVERWRGDRSRARWPARLDRGDPARGEFPWVGYYPEGATREF